jgi:hypothetical protein
MVEPRGMRWARRAALMDEVIKAYNILLQKAERRDYLEIGVKIILKVFWLCYRSGG